LGACAVDRCRGAKGILGITGPHVAALPCRVVAFPALVFVRADHDDTNEVSVSHRTDIGASSGDRASRRLCWRPSRE